MSGWRKGGSTALMPVERGAQGRKLTSCLCLWGSRDVAESKLKNLAMLLRKPVYLLWQIYTHIVYAQTLFTTHTAASHEWVDTAGVTPRNILSAECTNNYKHVPPVMTVCVMGDTNIGAVISQALKLAMTRSRMLFLPKQRGRHLLALPRHSQSMSKDPPLFDTAVCRYWIWSGVEER